jgi:hypothetical protein
MMHMGVKIIHDQWTNLIVVGPNPALRDRLLAAPE